MPNILRGKSAQLIRCLSHLSLSFISAQSDASGLFATAEAGHCCGALAARAASSSSRKNAESRGATCCSARRLSSALARSRSIGEMGLHKAEKREVIAAGWKETAHPPASQRLSIANQANQAPSPVWDIEARSKQTPRPARDDLDR